jgi:hypothetical protein
VYVCPEPILVKRSLLVYTVSRYLLNELFDLRDAARRCIGAGAVQRAGHGVLLAQGLHEPKSAALFQERVDAGLEAPEWLVDGSILSDREERPLARRGKGAQHLVRERISF